MKRRAETITRPIEISTPASPELKATIKSNPKSTRPSANWNADNRAGLFLATGLAREPAEKIYELWALAGNEPVPAGLFTLDRQGRALLKLAVLPADKTFDKFAVTVEPAGGVPKPTGPMHLLGSL